MSIVGRFFSWSVGIIDPVIFLIFTPKYREEVKILLSQIPFLGQYIGKVLPVKKSKSTRIKETNNRKSNATSTSQNETETSANNTTKNTESESRETRKGFTQT